MCVLRMPQVVALTGLSRMTIYRLEKRHQFPSRIQLSPNSVGCRKDDVEHWLESLPTVAATPPSAVSIDGVASRSEQPTRS
jgi:prophage regulatory protein